MREETKCIQDFLQEYLETYYKVLGTQKYNTYQFKDYFAYSLRGNYTFIKEELLLKAQINHYKQQSVELLFEPPAMQITWKYMGGNARRCDVRLSLDIEMKYNAFPVMTTIKNLEHHFVMSKEGRDWKIEDDYYQREFALPEEEADHRKRLFKKKEEKWEIRQHRIDSTRPKGIYNRDKAVEYAKKYALAPNTKEWKNYESYGGDCTNFVSQCLFAGGIPFDHQGKYVTQKWYWYSDYYRTPSFTSADALKTYMLNKEKFGLVATLGDLHAMRIGDLVQLGDLKKTTHSMIIVGVIKDDLGRGLTKDLLIAQHSGIGGIRGFNIPLSTKPNQRVYYNILGYNP